MHFHQMLKHSIILELQMMIILTLNLNGTPLLKLYQEVTTLHPILKEFTGFQEPIIIQELLKYLSTLTEGILEMALYTKLLKKDVLFGLEPFTILMDLALICT